MSNTTKGVLGALGEAEQIISIGIPLAGTVIPIATGLIKGIRQIATGTETVAYEILIQTDGAELDATHKLVADDLALINAERAKLGRPPIPAVPAVPAAAPATSAKGPAADPAPGTSSSV